MERQSTLSILDTLSLPYYAIPLFFKHLSPTSKDARLAGQSDALNCDTQLTNMTGNLR